MRVTREQIALAAFARLATVKGTDGVTPIDWAVRSRRWSNVNNATRDTMPAIYLVELPDVLVKPNRGLPLKKTYQFDIVVYAENPDRGDPTAPGEVINPILDALEDVFVPDNFQTNACTLGGLCEEAWFEGNVEKDYAYLGGAASMAVITMKVRLTNPK